MAKLQADLQKCLRQDWVTHYRESDFQGDWKIIALRSVGGLESIIFPTPNSDFYRDTDLLASCAYFQEVIRQLECPKDSIRLMQLFSNSEIKAHQDDLLGYTDGFFRLHIPIVTNPKVLFYFEEEAVHLPVGTCWFGNFNVTHRVENFGTTPRIHLVMDCHRNEWTDRLFKQFF